MHKKTRVLLTFALIALFLFAANVPTIQTNPGFTLKDVKIWQWADETEFSSVAVGNIDADPNAETITCRYREEGIRDLAQLVSIGNKGILVFLTSVLLSSVIPVTRFITPAIERVYGVFQDAFYATNHGDVEIVSVAYDPNIESYPDENMSPYGPDVNPTYDLVKQALVHLNPEDPDNPLSNIIRQGDTVVLKPNLVGKSAFGREGCTRTPILRPLVDFAVQAGASKVIIAEGSATPYPDSIVFGPDYSNIAGLVQALQSMYPDVVITYKDLNLDDFTWVDLGESSAFFGHYTPQELYSVNVSPMDENSYYHAQDSNGYDPEGYKPGLYAVANTVFQADVFINVPKMKVHWITGVTLSLKNLIGITVSSTGDTNNEEPIKDVPHWSNNAPKPVYDEVLAREDSFANDVVWRVMADLNKIVLYADENGVLQPVKQRKYLSVVDAIIGMEGPTVYVPPGVPRPTGAVIAGQNPVAVDAVCSRVMGFNYTVLNSLVNMEQISDHPIGKVDPTTLCVVETSLNGQTFGEPYVPHVGYEDSQIAPYRIRLQNFNPPEAGPIMNHPEEPREGIETRVIVHTQNIDLVVAGWLRYSLDGAGPLIVKMIPDGETMIGNLGLLEEGTTVSYDVCLQDYFLNADWSDKNSIFVHARRPPGSRIWVKTSNPSGSMDLAFGVAVDGTGVCIVGYDDRPGPADFRWRMETRDRTDGSLIWKKTSNPSSGEDRALGVAVSSTAVYMVGFDERPGIGDARWRIEKRSFLTGDRVWVKTFNPSSRRDEALGVAVHGIGVYTVGYDQHLGIGDARWRIEKRSTTDGSRIWSKTSNPSDGMDVANGVSVDSTGVYVVGYDMVKDNSRWRMEKRSLTDGSRIWRKTSNPSSFNDRAFDVAIDGTGLYIVGYDSSPGEPRWRIEKRDLTTGNLIWKKIGNPSSRADRAYGVAVDYTGVYIAGYDSTLSSSNTRWRIEKRDLTTGSRIWTKTVNPSSGGDAAQGVAVDGTGVYIVGSDQRPGDYRWRMEKRNL